MEIILKKFFDEKLFKDWDFIEKKNDLLIFQSYQWNFNWCKLNKIEENIRILIIYDKENPIFIFPLFVDRIFSFKVIRWIGYDLSDYNGPIVGDYLKADQINLQEIWGKVFDILKSESDLIFLDKMIDEENYLCNPFLKYMKCQNYDITYGINFSNWEETKKEKNKSFQKIRWSKRKLSNLEKLTFFENIQDVKKEELVMKIINWKNKTIKNKKKIAFKLYNENFYKKFINNKNIFFSGLKLGNDYISLSLNIELKKHILYLMPAYEQDNKILKYSPGKILMLELIQFYHDIGKNYFDFGNGKEFYKNEWSNNKRPLFCYIKNSNILGSLLMYLYKFKRYINLWKLKIF